MAVPTKNGLKGNNMLKQQYDKVYLLKGGKTSDSNLAK